MPVLLTATGCVTVHGEREIIPSVDKAEAPRVLKRFTDGYTAAYRKLDPALVDRVEGGALAEIGRADVTAQRAATPQGNPGYPALVLDDARFTIPKMAGWPKFFVADTRSNRDKNRWLVVFTREGAQAPWKASYLSLMAEDKVPRFALDKDGYAQVPGAARKSGGDAAEPAGPAVAPEAVSGAYTDYLRTGQGSAFAPGAPSLIRDERAKLVRTPTFWTEYIDTPEKAPSFPAPALSTPDGGALVFFTAHHREKRTMAKGLRPSVSDPRTKALLSGDLQHAVTFTRVSESAVLVPPKKSGPEKSGSGKGASDGGIVFLNRIESLTVAKGE
ncbi:hypothetical protein [Streptomyces olivoverticillatus]|uniref:hypothetical protein n=1 Tax=Streptomyces olivoverticillatus TaxID=66427 RepID=UPI001C87ABDE|nr:hypothetical protein [Streptomyces olivoverticillatus]